MSKHITVETEKCVGCHTCEIACAIAHSKSGDIEVMMLNGETPGYRVRVGVREDKPVPHTCLQCEKAACVLACPTGAVRRLAPGKPVLVDEEKCTGCARCVEACPFDMIEIQQGGSVAMKCDLCIRRLAKHEPPACVAACPTKALKFEEDAVRSKV